MFLQEMCCLRNALQFLDGDLKQFGYIPYPVSNIICYVGVLLCWPSGPWSS